MFVLLETLFHEFDKIANRRKIYKVETIGDCYIAVCGLPTPNKDHAGTLTHRCFGYTCLGIDLNYFAVEMCLFAIECMKRTKTVSAQLAATLGPSTERKLVYSRHNYIRNPLPYTIIPTFSQICQ